MRRAASIVVLAVVTCVIYGIVSDPAAFFQGIVDTLAVWLYKVYPAIFTFYLLSALLINTRLIDRIIYYLNPVLKHLRFRNAESLYLFILSVFTGNPGSVDLIGATVEKQEITVTDGNELLKYASFLNPLFIFSFWGAHNIKYAIILIFVHIATNFLIARHANRANPKTIAIKKPITFSPGELFASLNKIIGILLMIAAVMTAANILYFSMMRVLSLLGEIPLIARLLLANIEIAVGLNSVAAMNLAGNVSLLIFAFLIGFAGLSIHMQVYIVATRYRLDYAVYFKYRLLQGAVSVMLLLPFIALE